LGGGLSAGFDFVEILGVDDCGVAVDLRLGVREFEAGWLASALGQMQNRREISFRERRGMPGSLSARVAVAQMSTSARHKPQERFLSAQADQFAGSELGRKASACSVRNDGPAVAIEKKASSSPFESRGKQEANWEEKASACSVRNDLRFVFG
jgi:hypothetical protein